MAGRIPRDFIDDLVARSDIVDVIESRVPLKRGGKNYLACCPFHKEKSPSFSVTPSKQFYYCFGCGAHGNVISFLMDYDRSSFVEAVETLAGKIGVQIPYESVSPVQQQRYAAKKKAQATILTSLELANSFYKLQLRQHKSRSVAVDYFKSRGLSGKMAQQFQLGYAPPGWDNLLNYLGEQADPDQKELVLQNALAAGLVVEKDDNRKYDRFRDRIMFPIRNVKGQVIAFGGRVLNDEKPKYLNSPETEVFKKSEELYGLYELMQSGNPSRIMVVEGYMDVIALHQFGITNVVATLGTATGPAHINKLFKQVKEVIFCFDGDAAGRKAAWRGLENALPLSQEGRQIKFLFLPDGEDPDTLVRKEGVELFQHRMDKAMPLTKFLLNTMSENLDISTIDGRAQLVSETIPLLKTMPNNLMREMVVQEVARLAEVDSSSIAAKVTAEAAKYTERQKAAQQERVAQGGSFGNSAAVSDEPDWPSEPLANYDAYSGLGPDTTKNSSGGFRSTQRRGLSKRSSVSLVESLIRGLLQNPGLVANAVFEFDLQELADDLPLLHLLKAILDQFKADPRQSLPALFGLWHNTDLGQQLADIAAKEFLIENTHTEQEFHDGLKKLHELHCQRAIENEMNNANPDGEKLKALLERQRSFDIPPLVSEP